MTGDDVPDDVLAALREVCSALPEAYEEQAWVGTRWRVRSRTFAHVLPVEPGYPPAYARVVGNAEPVVVVTFRAQEMEMAGLLDVGPRYFRARWGRDVMGLVLDDDVDWAEVAELLTESYCRLAPKKLVALVHRPTT